MDAAQFRLPVRLDKSDGSHIAEVYSAEEALDFLLAWHEPRGRVYDKAVKACFAATVDVATADEAQRAFASFARTCGILARDMWPVAGTRRGRSRSMRPSLSQRAGAA